MHPRINFEKYKIEFAHVKYIPYFWQVKIKSDASFHPLKAL